MVEITLEFTGGDEGRVVMVERDVLTAHSDFFAAMFGADMFEARTNTVKLHDVGAYEASVDCDFFTYGSTALCSSTQHFGG